jgi:hypothetical protein
MSTPPGTLKYPGKRSLVDLSEVLLNKPFHEFIDGVIDIFRGNAELSAGFFNLCNPV